MKRCYECNGKFVKMEDKTPEGFTYEYYHCTKCGNEILDMKQLNEVADKYRAMKKYRVKLTRWGKSIGLRLPKELIEEYSLEKRKEVSLIPEKKSMRIVPV